MTKSKQTNQRINQKINSVNKKVNKLIPIATKHSNLTNTKAKIRDSQDGIRVRHREFIAECLSSIAFQSRLNEYINPANSTLFPWLSRMSANYEKFRIHSLNIEYIHTVSTTVSGLVASVIDYDPHDPMPSSLSLLLNSYRARPSAYYDDFKMKFAPQTDALKWYLIDHDGEASMSDVDRTLYYPGSANIFCSGAANDTTTVGLLYVDYDIELSIPSTINPTGSLEPSNASQMATFGSALGYVPPINAENGLLPFLMETVSSMAPGYVPFHATNGNRLYSVPHTYNGSTADSFTLGNPDAKTLSLLTPNFMQLLHSDFSYSNKGFLTGFGVPANSKTLLNLHLRLESNSTETVPPVIAVHSDTAVTSVVDYSVQKVTEGIYYFWDIKLVATITCLVVTTSLTVTQQRQWWGMTIYEAGAVGIRALGMIAGSILMEAGEQLFITSYEGILPTSSSSRFNPTARFKQAKFDHATIGSSDPRDLRGVSLDDRYSRSGGVKPPEAFDRSRLT